MKKIYKFCVGPWNISEGRDTYGPETRIPRSMAWKLRQFKAAGFDAVMFHDDDIVPDLDSLSPSQVLRKAGELAKKVRDEGLMVEMVAPRLWFSPRTIDGGFTSNRSSDRRYAIKRSLQAIDIAEKMDTKLIVLWVAREGTYVRESKNYAQSLQYLVEAVNAMLRHHPYIRIAIEPKPNEPMDVSYLPTIGHVLAFAHMTDDPSRVGGVIESAHCILSGLDPADEMEFALTQGKLWSVHLNDQNGLKFDQDKPFGSVNLRSAFDQVRVLKRGGYGKQGECICFDVHSFSTTKDEDVMKPLINSRHTFLKLLRKVDTFDEEKAQALASRRDYQDLDQLILDHLLGVDSIVA